MRYSNENRNGKEQFQHKLKAPPPELLDFIRGGDRFIIAGHKEPDGDCAGSQLTLASALKRLGKNVLLCSSGPFRKPEILKYEKQFFDFLREEDCKDARLIITDCNSLERTGKVSSFLEKLPMAVIDHHELSKSLPEDIPVYREPESPSSTLLVFKLIKALGLEVTEEEAKLLLFGLCTDTGFFRHVDEKGSETFETAAMLVSLGASPQKAFHEMNGGKSLESRNFMGCVLSGAESFYGGRLIISSEKYEDIKRFGLENRDSDSVYQQLLSISGVEAIVLIRQENPDSCSMGLRSRDRIDIQKIAAIFGGGGHKNASGVNLVDGTIDEIKLKVIKAFEKEF